MAHLYTSGDGQVEVPKPQGLNVSIGKFTVRVIYTFVATPQEPVHCTSLYVNAHGNC